jgi:hypothetical protein
MIEGARLNASTATTANATYNSGDGKFPITVVATNSWGSTTKTITDYMVVTSIDDVAAEGGYMVYPQPFEGTANVLFAEDGLFEVAVFAADGKLVANNAFQVRAGELREVSLASAEQGVYVYFITSGDGETGDGEEFDVYYSSQLESALSHSEGFSAL